ncbi:hypothetical protein AB0L99_37060 [Streptomyces sp. NPDC051954]|uniref:hypothetical protein n=1 Tax=unclassified Streptomyces TaxID=2593676 RepID=UPI003447FA64
MRSAGLDRDRTVGQQEQPDAESGDRQNGTDGRLHRAGTTAGPDPRPETVLVLWLEGGVLLGVAHELRQLPFEVVHDFSLTPPAR